MRNQIVLLISCLLVTTAWAASGQRPNVLLIVSDDQGYADVGFHGSKEVPTPQLDRLARRGVIFENGYVSHPFCSPTRAGLLTGRYQHRFGHEENPYFDPTDRTEGLPLTERLLPEILRASGYVTGWVGKWHLGAAPHFKPSRRGFAETFGFIGGGHRYLNWSPNPSVEYMVPVERNDVAVEVTEHLTTVFGHEAAGFVQRHSGRPWFLYLAFNAPHTPHEPTPERLARFTAISDPKRRAYVAQVSLMDDAIGETLAAVESSGQSERTLVFFFSDNGGAVGPAQATDNSPLRDFKGSVYEGGVRVPFVMSWPRTLPAGTRYRPAVSSLDVFATTLAVAGVAMPRDRTYDSVDLIPFLTGRQGGEPHDHLFWRAQRGQWAVRDSAGWKLVRQAGRPDELYHLSQDIGETSDRAAAEPARLRTLTSELAAWDRQMIPPAFAGASVRNAAKASAKKKSAP